MFPLLYHAQHSQYQDDIPFWLKLAQTYGDPLLELGCGTGRVSQALAQAGCSVYALDNDAQMLSAFRLLEKNQHPVHVFQADMAAFRLGRRFPLILLPCNTYSVLPGAARQATLERVCQHLQPGGVFAVSMPNPDLLLSLPARGAVEVEDIYAHPLDGQPVQVSSGWRRTARHFVVTWFYDHLHPDGKVTHLSTQARHQLQSPQAYLQEIQQSGLEIVATFGDFDESPYSPEALQLLVVARRLERCF